MFIAHKWQGRFSRAVDLHGTYNFFHTRKPICKSASVSNEHSNFPNSRLTRPRARTDGNVVRSLSQRKMYGSVKRLRRFIGLVSRGIRGNANETTVAARIFSFATHFGQFQLSNFPFMSFLLYLSFT